MVHSPLADISNMHTNGGTQSNNVQNPSSLQMTKDKYSILFSDESSSETNITIEDQPFSMLDFDPKNEPSSQFHFSSKQVSQSNS
jgi:hypothetical protein